QAAAALAESYARSGQPGEAMRWAARALESAPAQEHDSRLKDFERALDAAPGRDIAKLVSDLDRKSPAWPAAALKLARIQLHLGDRSHARELASDIVSADGQGPYADTARGVLKAAQEPGPLNPRLLGIALPLTGDLKGFADQALNGIALTLDLQGRGSLMVEVVDTKGEPDAAADAVDQLAQRGAIAILGPLGIAEGLAAATRAHHTGIPLLSLPPADREERQQFSDEAEKIMKEIKDPYRRRKALSQLRNQQAPIVDFDAMFIPDSARTVRLIAPAIAAEDVITTGCDTKELEVVQRTTKTEQLRPVQLLGPSLWDSPDLVDERSGVARYVQCSIFVDVFFANSERPATKKFVDDFNSAYRRSPGFLEAHAFDAASILKRVLDERRPQSRDDLRAALANLSKPFEGAAGDTVFGRDREAQKPFFWLWINRGNILEFDPEGPPPVPPA